MPKQPEITRSLASASRRVLRTRPWLAVVVLGANLLFLGGAAFFYAELGWTAISIGFAAFSALGVIGLLKLAVSRIVLECDSLETHKLLSRHRYKASEIQSFKWEAGSGVTVKLVQGGWAKLPELGYNSQSLVNILRAWLKSCQQEKE